jgi:Phage integrase family
MRHELEDTLSADHLLRVFWTLMALPNTLVSPRLQSADGPRRCAAGHPIGEGKRRFWRFTLPELSAWLMSRSNQGAPALTSSRFWLDFHQPPVRVMEIHRRSHVNQQGSLLRMKRNRQPDVWVFRHYANDAEGQRRYRKTWVGTLLQYPTRKDAEKAIASLRHNINEGAVAPHTVGELIAHFNRNELDRRSFSTAAGYRIYFARYIQPKWGQHPLTTVRAIEVEAWLDGLRGATGKLLAPGTRSKIRNIMSALFSYGIRHQWVIVNPIQLNGRQLLQPDMILKRHLRPALEALGIKKQIGWHSFRLGLATMLRQQGVDLKLAQAMLRHANSRITLEVYQQGWEPKNETHSNG